MDVQFPFGLLKLIIIVVVAVIVMHIYVMEHACIERFN